LIENRKRNGPIGRNEAMTDTYCYLHLQGPGRDSTALQRVLRDRVLGAWDQAGIGLWGVWEGLFGVASNELLVMAVGSGERSAADFLGAVDDLKVVDSLVLVPTVRPERNVPCSRDGLYVFRFFGVSNVDVEEVAGLSRKAWETFETSAEYLAEPQGLFRQQDQNSEIGSMLLVTWHDGLESWQISRRPAPEAMENFQRRRELTLGTRALATRLLPSPGG
jgi:hypothetical protein